MAAVIYEKNPYGDNIVIIPTGGGSKAHFDGLTPAVVNQGAGFDLTEGVKAYDDKGKEVTFTVSPEEIDACAIGNQTFTYTAGELTQDRIITVQAISDPVISGLTPLTVEVNEEFDPLDGVSAVDGNGNSVEVTVEEPTPSERLLLSGGAEDFIVSASSVTIYDISTTREYDGTYDGRFTIKITNLQYKEEYEGEWTTPQDYEYTSNYPINYTASDISFYDEALPLGNAYLRGDGTGIECVTEDDSEQCYKWDSLEIWTYTE